MEKIVPLFGKKAKEVFESELLHFFFSETIWDRNNVKKKRVEADSL